MADVALAYANSEAAKLGGQTHDQIGSAAEGAPDPARHPQLRALQLSKREPVGRFFVVMALKVDGERVGMARVDLEGQLGRHGASRQGWFGPPD